MFFRLQKADLTDNRVEEKKTNNHKTMKIKIKHEKYHEVAIVPVG